jgi:seryl-tRNA synthetase
MLDIKFIRENKDLVQDGAKKKHIDINIDELVALDDKRLELLRVVEDMRAEQNRTSMMIGNNLTVDERAQMIAEMSSLKEDIKTQEETLKTIMADWQKMMVHVPNLSLIHI